jgi:uncharacterized protein (TIGR00270 family)
MDCEMCGKPATAVARVEGAQMHVCPVCVKYGTLVRTLPVLQKAKKAAVKTEEIKEELIESVRTDVGKLLRQHREKLKLNQDQFAAKLQIRGSTYNHYESGSSIPDITTARKLEQVLKVPLVVHIKVSTPIQTKHEESRGLTMGDFLKK